MQPQKQHWLPCVYLKHFSPDASKRSKSKVWRFDGSINRDVPVESQCSDKFFYSIACAKEAEDCFNQIETLYDGCVRKIVAGAAHRPTFQEYFGLILMVFDLHLRNKAQQNLTTQNNLEAYRTRLFLFLRDMFLGRSEGTPDERELKSHLQTHWRVNIIVPSADSEFITSDNPAMIFTTNDRHDCHYALLPITPGHLAVAFDQRFIEIRPGHTTQADDELLNRNQCRQASSAIYSRTKLDAEQERNTARLLNEPRKHGAISQSSVEFTGLKMLPGANLSFIGMRSRHPCE